MKKLITTIIIIVLLPIHVNCKPKGELTFGYANIKSIVIDKQDRSFNYYAELGISSAYNKLTIFSTVETWAYPKSGTLNGAPYRIGYTIGADYKINNNLSLIVEHQCNHPVESSFDAWQSNQWIVQYTMVGFKLTY